MAHTSILSKVAYYGNNITEYKASADKTRIDARRLGEKANIKYSTLTKIEGGVVTKPSVQTIQEIAKSLDVPMEELVK